MQPPAPTCTLRVTTTKVPLKKRHKAKPGTLPLKASCDQAAAGTLSGTIKAVIRKKTKTFHLRPVHISLTAGAAELVTVKLPGSALKALKRKAKESVTFQLAVSNANGTAAATAKVPRLRGAR
jgi:hypothetical protein